MAGLVAFLLLLSFAFGDTFIVKFKDSSTQPVLAGFKIIKRFKNYALVEARNYTSLVKALSVDTGVEYIARNIKLRAFAVPNDPGYPDQWGLKIIKAERAWDVNTDCSSVIVAVVDSGVDYFHEDLNGNIWINTAEAEGYIGEDDDGNGYVDDCYGWDFVQSDAIPLDENGHGTHTAGIIGAVGNNSVGVTGVCWKAKIMVVRILDASGLGDAFSFLKAVHYAVDNGARVINTSLGTCPIGHSSCDISDPNDPSLKPLRDAVEYALNHAVIIVAASGNDGIDTDQYPVFPASYSKDYPNVISVASIDSNGKLSSFSNYGVNTVDVAAPGGSDENNAGIVSTWIDNSYAEGKGTSIAAPFVTAEIAYILSSNPNLTPSEVKNRVISNVQGDNSLQGKIKSGGCVDLQLTLSALSYSYSRVSGLLKYGTCGKPRLSGSSGGGCSTSGGGYIFLLIPLVLLLRRSLPYIIGFYGSNWWI